MIKLDDGTLNKVGPLSTMKIAKLSTSIRGAQTDMGIDLGKSWMMVKKLRSQKDSFKVSTPSAVAGVRGTYFSSEVEQTADSTFDVFEGEVDVAAKGGNQGSVLLGTNFRSKVSKGADPTSPAAIPQEDLAKGISEGIMQAGPNQAGNYDVEVKVEPQVIEPGGTATLKVQFKENGKPYNGAVVFTLNLGGKAKFVQNGTNSMDAQSNQQGYAEVQISDEMGEQVQVGVDVAFAQQE